MTSLVLLARQLRDRRDACRRTAGAHLTMGDLYTAGVSAGRAEAYDVAAEAREKALREEWEGAT